MTNYVDLAFAAAERAGTLPRGFLRVRDAQRVLADYQRVMRADFWIRHRVSIASLEGNPPADRTIVNRIP